MKEKHIAGMGRMLRRVEGKGALGRSRCRYKDNISILKNMVGGCGLDSTG
jgi:hypothetical protein